MFNKNIISHIKGNLKTHGGKTSNSLNEELEAIEKLGVNIITVDDEQYPENLKHIYDPPKVLYVKGGFKPEDCFNIAIVGTRRASLYGQQNAERFAAELAERGFTITSGLARGIDTLAHKGAIKRGGRTIAVLGCGIDIAYPPENKKLMEEIEKKGAIISEFPIGTPPLKYNFPIRNRIISGLSMGVLVIEAPEKSGALITVSYALEQGREVFSLPGRIDTPTSKGTLGLIKDGAKLVQTIDDILEELQSLPEKERKEHEKENFDISGLTDEEKSVINVLSEEPMHIDEIKSNVDVSNISSILLKLELKKAIRELPGKHYVRV